MKYKLYALLVSTIFLITTVTNAQAVSVDTAVDNQTNYFQALKKIQELAPGVTAVLPCNIEQKKYFIALLTQNGLNKTSDGSPKIKMDNNGNVSDNYDEDMQIYRGDFNNQGAIEYLLITTSGSLAANTVSAVYKVVGKKLVALDFDGDVKVNLGLRDLSRFYLFTAKPFAYIKDNKTYLRFLKVSSDYNPAELQVCTYLWQQRYFTLISGQSPTCLPSVAHF